MTSYYRPRVPSWLVISLLITAGLVALVYAARETVTWIRDDTRAKLAEEASAFTRGQLAIQRAALSHRFDSLRTELVQRDSLAAAADARARAALARLAHTIVEHHDSIPAAVQTDVAAVVNACTAVTDDCATYREKTARALTISDSVHVADSTHVAALTMVAAVARDSTRTITAQLAHRPTWGTTAKAGGAGVVVGALLCVFFCR